MTSAAVLNNIILMLEEHTDTIAVCQYIQGREYTSVKHYDTYLKYVTICSLDKADLGLDPNCKLQRIWGGDEALGVSVLHVLYTRDGEDHYLASYTMMEEFYKLLSETEATAREGYVH